MLLALTDKINYLKGWNKNAKKLTKIAIKN